jgi:hypothetical protein
VTGCVIEGTRDRLVRLQPRARWLTSATPARLHHSYSIPPLPPRSSSTPPAPPATPPGPDRHHTLAPPAPPYTPPPVLPTPLLPCHCGPGLHHSRAKRTTRPVVVKFFRFTFPTLKDLIMIIAWFVGFITNFYMKLYAACWNYAHCYIKYFSF